MYDKKICKHDFGLLGSALEGFVGLLKPWWQFLVARKRALECSQEGSVTVKYPSKSGNVAILAALWVLKGDVCMRKKFANMILGCHEVYCGVLGGYWNFHGHLLIPARALQRVV